MQPTSTFRPNPRLLTSAGVAGILALAVTAQAQTTQYFAGDGSALTASKYSGTPTGPTFTTAFTSGNILGFGVANGTGSGAGGLTIGGISALENFTFSSPTGTLATGGKVVGISVADGKTLNLGTLGFSTAAGTGFTKNGNGTLFTSNGNQYAGGFTLNAGTVIVGGVNALGATSTLAINGGIIASNATRDLTGKYTGGITVGGDFQLGALTANSALASDTANLTFSNNIALGTATTRTITLGNKGNQTLGGTISGTSGLTFAAVAGTESTAASNGTFALTGTANTFTGAININGPEVSFAADGSLGNAANTVNIEGGRLTVTSTSTITATRGIQVGSAAGTSISTKGGSTVITYNGVIANLNGETGTFAKQGGGTLVLGGISTYSGDTSINNGTIQLTTGNNRLPTGTTVNLGQAASSNLGSLDLNGQGQQIAGLNSVAGTNASTTAKNTVTSATNATLTLGGGGNYNFGAGTAANSGVITGAIAVTKSGSGTQTFGDANTYTGGTQINGGALVVGNASGSSATGTGTVTVNNGGTLLGNGYIAVTSGSISVSGVLSPGGTSLTAGTVDTIHLAANAGLTFNTGFTLSFDITSPASKDLVAMTSLTALVLNGGTLALNLPNTTATAIDYSQTYALFTGVSGVSGTGFSAVTGYDTTDYTPSFMLNGNEYDLSFNTVTAVPEPATFLGGLMLAGLVVWSKRRVWHRSILVLILRTA